MAISDTYIPFWFADALPELEKPDSDRYALMRQLGKNPCWCTETVDVVQATSKERLMFELSPDDPAPLLKIVRQSFDDQGNALDVQFLTDRSDMYRLHYSLPLFASGVPEPLREK
jgi:DNA-binding GntR family transcriptional regulator